MLAALVAAGPAQAKSFTLPEADVRVMVEGNGALDVTERITFAFSGDFSGAFRDIPLRDGERISDVQVLEGQTAYRPGGCAELGCSSPAGTF